MNTAVVQTLKGLPRIHSLFVFAGRKGAHMNDLRSTGRNIKKAKIENFHWDDLRHIRR